MVFLKYRLFFLCFGLMFFLFVSAQNDKPFQLWNIDEVSYKVSTTLTLSVNQELHWVDNITLLSYNHTELKSTWRITKVFFAGIDFRHVRFHDQLRYNEERPELSVIARMPAGRFIFINRLRTEYRMFTIMDDYIRGVNRFFVIYPVTLFNHSAEPYFSTMHFYAYSDQKLEMARYYCGIIYNWNKHFSNDLCVMHLSVNKSNWQYFYVLIAGAKYTIR